MHGREWKKGQAIFSRLVPHNKMKCLCSGQQLKVDEMIRSPESVTTKDRSASGYSSQNCEGEQRLDTSNIEEAESSLREGVHLNYEVGLFLWFSILTFFAVMELHKEQEIYADNLWGTNNRFAVTFGSFMALYMVSVSFIHIANCLKKQDSHNIQESPYMVFC